MFKLYKDLVVKYWLGILVLILLTYTSLTLSPYASPYSGFGCVLILVPLIVIWAFYLNQKAVKRLHDLRINLLFACRVRDYMNAYQILLDKPVARRMRKVRQYLLRELSAGYDALGDHAEALRLLGTAPIDISKKRGRLEWLVYANNAAVYYVHAGDVENTRKAVEDLKRALAAADYKQGSNYIFCQANLNRIEYQLAVESGRGASVRGALEIELANAPYLLQKVGICQSLAEIHLQAGDTAGAQEYIRYILQYGGDTRYVPWAKTKLQEIDQMSHEKADT